MNKKNVFKQTILSLSNGVEFFDSHSFIKNYERIILMFTMSI